MNGRLYDPINVFCSIALVSLHEPGTRIDLNNNTVCIQPPTASQGLSRLFRSSRGDMYTLLHPMKRFVELTCLGVEILSYRTPQHRPQADTSIPPPPPLELEDEIAEAVAGKGAGTGTSVAHAPEMASGINRSPIQRKEKESIDLVNHLYKNVTLLKLLRYYKAGIRALQKAYSEDNAEAALQQAFNVVTDAFDLLENRGDVSRALRLLPPSCANYSSSIIDQSAVIQLWTDGTLDAILELFDGYMSEPLPQNLLTCRSAVSELLAKKNADYQILIAKGSK